MASKRKALSIEAKLEIIQAVENGRKKKDVAAEFGIPASTLSNILVRQEQIRSSLSGTIKQDRKRFRAPTFPDVENALLIWFKDVRARNLPISGAILEEKANSLAFVLGHTEFKASSGWVSRFKDRHDIVCHQLSGEAASVSSNTVNEWNAKLKPIINKYASRDVYNMDETGLFFRVLPERSLSFKNEKCHGGKKSKDRLTLVAACNMDGSDKRKMGVIGKSKKPRCFKGVTYLPVDYQANKKAWLTSALFEVWLRNFNDDMKRQKRKVLLVLDNCTAHKVAIKLDSVSLLYLPPNTTSMLQPLDQGIIRSLKAHYRKRIVSRVVFDMDAKRETVINVKSAIDLIYGAWNSVDPVVIRNCFRKAGFVQDGELEAEPEADCPAELWERLGVTESHFEDFVSVDEGVETAPTLTDLEIVQQVQPVDDGGSSSDEEDAAPPKTLTSVESLDMVAKLKDFFTGLTGVKEEDMQQCLLGLQRCEMLIMSNGCEKKQTKISDFFK